MRLLLDTTYLLPALGISVKGLPRDVPIKLAKAGHQIYISDITVFELSAKAAKQIATGILPAIEGAYHNFQVVETLRRRLIS